MKIDLKLIKLKEIIKGYINNDDEGVLGFEGKLNIRPSYQREFIYNDKEKCEVVKSVLNNFPLNIMYWSKNNDGTFELVDGQQRTISICEYLNNNFTVDFKYYQNLTEEEKESILNYELNIYICEGTEKEKLDWFHVINIAGEKLTEQELRNSVYTGSWLSNAKLHFSKRNCSAFNLAKDYLNGSAIRQDYLETAIKWISENNIEEYMAKHQLDKDADELWTYFRNVINWVKILFPTYRKEMKGIDWGFLYNKYEDKKFNSQELERKVNELMEDFDVSNKKGIYSYLITGDEKYLNIRVFDQRIKRTVYEKQEGLCLSCKNKFDIDEMDADHIIPWSEGGKTEIDNCQLLCKNCNRKKSNN